MLDVVQRYLPQLFSERPKPLTHGTHVFDTMITVKAQPAELDEAIRMLDGVLNGHQGLIDLTFSARCQLRADGDALDPARVAPALSSS